MAVALKENEERTKIEAAEWEDDEDDLEPGYEEFPDLPFVYGYDRQGYLVEDGQLMAETTFHRHEINDRLAELEIYFASHPDVYVAGCDYLHYKKGDRTTKLSPDGYVIFGVSKRDDRENFKTFEEDDKTPAIVFEFTSTKTKKFDESEKFAIYEQTLKTPEYILFDPRPFRRPRVRLRAYRLNMAGRYEAIPRSDTGRVYSEQLDLYLEEQGQHLRFFDAKTGNYLPTREESEAQRKVAELRAGEEARRAMREAQARRQEKKRADDAEAEIALLRAELEALRNQKQSEKGQ